MVWWRHGTSFTPYTYLDLIEDAETLSYICKNGATSITPESLQYYKGQSATDFSGTFPIGNEARGIGGFVFTTTAQPLTNMTWKIGYHFLNPS